MSSRTRTNLAAALVVALLAGGYLAWRLWQPEGEERQAPGSAPSPVPGAAADPAGGGEEPESAQPADPEEPGDVEAEASPEGEAPVTDEAVLLDGYGSVQVTVSRADGQPVSGGAVRLYAWGDDDPHLASRLARIGAGGVALFDPVRAGRVLVQGDRGGTVSGTVRPDERLELELVVPLGVNVEGIVVDPAGRPVEGAAIWLSVSGNWLRGAVVTASAPDGTFQVDSVGEFRWIQARAAGFAPSPFTAVWDSPGVTVRIRLVLGGPGGAIEGLVLDEAGLPVEGAAVLAASEETVRMRSDADGRNLCDALHLTTRSQADGTFQIPCAPAGEVPLTVRKAALAPWTGRVTVPPRGTVTVTVVLTTGAVLEGTVRDGEGEPVAGARVEAGRGSEIHNWRARTRADGSYRLEGLPDGSLEVRAEAQNRGKADAMVQFRAGETTGWDPVLSLGRELRVRLVDEKDQPLTGWWILGQNHRVSPGYHEGGNTDDEGRLRLANCPEAGVELSVHEPGSGAYSSIYLKKVLPGPDELVLRVEPSMRATARITGVVVDAAGNPLGDARVVPRLAGRNTAPIERADVETGRFDIGPIPPGEYSIRIEATDHPPLRIPGRLLAPGETWDLGFISLETGGHVTATLRRADGKPPGQPSLWITSPTGQRTWELTLEGSVARSGALAPGPYTLWGQGDGSALSLVEFQIRAGQETQAVLELIPGVRCAVEVVVQDESTFQPAGCEVRDAEQRLRGTLWLRPRVMERRTLEVHLRPGEYVARVVREGVVLAEQAFQVSEGGAGPGTVRLVVP